MKYAEEEYRKAKDYDRVYCVFDRDGHANFDQAIDRIRGSSLYSKDFSGIYAQLEPWLGDAITHGARLETENGRTGSDNPSTQLHELVKYLRDLRATA